MDDEERISLIRRGNELFNNKDYKNALKIFIATDYKDGIIRVADYLYFEKNDKISAIKLYKKAGHQKVIDDFAQKAAYIIRMMLDEDKEKEKLRKEIEESFVSEWKPVVIKREEIENLDKKE
ncbi:MAG: hypothetical protein ACP5Q5_09835 [Brevinematia bacterium]